MSIRRLIVEVELEGLNVTEFCAQHGVSTWFFYQLRKRYAAEGEAGLEPRSRAAKTVANRTPDWVEDLVVEKRKELVDAGWDAGPATIWTHLSESLPLELVPSEATIWRILTRRGFITPEPKKAPEHSYRTFAAERANECWQLDDIGYELVDGTAVKIITIIDDCTRLCPRLKAVVSVNGQAAFDAFCAAATRWGWPQRFLSDNANAYKISLAGAVGAIGVDHRHGRPGHPQTQGKVERFHQTLQKWLKAQPSPSNLEALQSQLDDFTDHYNTKRPHRAIGRKPPATIWKQTPKTGPADRPLTTPTSIHRVTVTGGICHINKTYSITIGAAHTGQQATVIITDLTCHVFIAGRLIRQLTLDPTRRYQPLYDRPGRP
ncbi:MAG TPA: integrase core domain-containing protein [Acidimicrobiia bacterium]|nr:integrase core domain-containing protein [Acidimicrobiia bacterium]